MRFRASGTLTVAEPADAPLVGVGEGTIRSAGEGAPIGFTYQQPHNVMLWEGNHGGLAVARRERSAEAHERELFPARVQVTAANLSG